MIMYDCGEEDDEPGKLNIPSHPLEAKGWVNGYVQCLRDMIELLGDPEKYPLPILHAQRTLKELLAEAEKNPWVEPE